jgi:hypothetical protein
VGHIIDKRGEVLPDLCINATLGVARPADIAMPELAVMDFVSEKQPENKTIPRSRCAAGERNDSCVGSRKEIALASLRSKKQPHNATHGIRASRRLPDDPDLIVAASGRHLQKPTLQ